MGGLAGDGLMRCRVSKAISGVADVRTSIEASSGALHRFIMWFGGVEDGMSLLAGKIHLVCTHFRED
jgi:hypothetical protein